MNKNPDRYEVGDVAVEWYNAGEGRFGDYDPKDPEDINLLRFDFYGKRDGEWVPVIDGSYCTQVPADTPNRILSGLLEILLDNAADNIEIAIAEEHWIHDGEILPMDKRLFEELSWIEPSWYESDPAIKAREEIK